MSASKHEYQATVVWTRTAEAKFTDQRYSRRHEWRFDGGSVVPASSSPKVVPVPMSAEDAVDPEEAFIASLSACHMLFFLFHAAKKGYVIDEYEDRALGVMGKTAEGRTAMLEVRLRPRIRWSDGREPSREELDEMHHRSHEDCFIANSVKTAVHVEAAA